jgi:hypothetical protein
METNTDSRDSSNRIDSNGYLINLLMQATDNCFDICLKDMNRFTHTELEKNCIDECYYKYFKGSSLYTINI